MKLDRENYGIFIIDYFDGNLSEAEKEKLLLFLDDNIDLKKEFKDFGKVTLSKPVITFPEKEKLKIPIIKATQLINKDNYESFFILFHDGELKEDEAKELVQFLDQNPHLSGELELFGKILLEKNTKVVFPNKVTLKHRKPVTLQIAFAVAMAAMFLMYFGFKFLLPGESNIPAAKQNYRMAALEILPAMTLSMTVTPTEALRIKSQPQHLIPEATPVIAPKQAPMEMLASLDAPVHFDNLKSTNTLLYASRAVTKKAPEQSHPVVVEETHNSLLASAFTRPIDRIAGYLALRKREKMNNETHDKPFVELLEGGVKTFNFLTNNDVLFAKTYNSKGNLTGYQLLSDNVNIDHNIRPASNER